METLDAVVLAAGRLAAADVAQAGHELKGLVRIGTLTPLQAMIEALRASGRAKDIVVVGPVSAQGEVTGFDRWIPEGASGEDNLLAGLQAAQSRRVLLCASDIPFVQGDDIRDFVDRAPLDAVAAYPIFERDEFLAHFPGGRDAFARIGGKAWTGGSICVVERETALARKQLMRQTFGARRSQLGMAALLGPAVLLKRAMSTLRLEDVIDRASQLLGGKAVAVRGANPRLAMDCDSMTDIEYVRSLAGRLGRA